MKIFQVGFEKSENNIHMIDYEIVEQDLNDAFSKEDQNIGLDFYVKISMKKRKMNKTEAIETWEGLPNNLKNDWNHKAAVYAMLKKFA